MWFLRPVLFPLHHVFKANADNGWVQAYVALCCACGRAITLAPCYQLGVLVCQWFEIIIQFSHSVPLSLKGLVFLVSAKSAMANRQALWQVLV